MNDCIFQPQMAMEKPKFCSAAFIRFIKTRRSSPDAAWSCVEPQKGVIQSTLHIQHSQYTSVKSSQFWWHCATETASLICYCFTSAAHVYECSPISGSHKALDALWNYYLLIIYWIRQQLKDLALIIKSLLSRYFCVKACLYRTGLQIRRFEVARVSYGKYAKFIFLRHPNEIHDSPAS